MTTPQITVLIDTYNYGRFIEEAIDSVLSQDFPMEQVQVLVVDDGSTDDTPERVKKYGSRIEYFHKANGGQASALNAGFARARERSWCCWMRTTIFCQGSYGGLRKNFRTIRKRE